MADPRVDQILDVGKNIPWPQQTKHTGQVPYIPGFEPGGINENYSKRLDQFEAEEAAKAQVNQQPRIEASSRDQIPRTPVALAEQTVREPSTLTDYEYNDNPSNKPKNTTRRTVSKTTQTSGAPGSPSNRSGSGKYKTGSARSRDPIQELLWRQRTESLNSLYSEQGWDKPSYLGQYVNHSTHKTKDGREFVYDSQNNKWIEVTNPYAGEGGLEGMRQRWEAAQEGVAPLGFGPDADAFQKERDRQWNEWNKRRIANEALIRAAEEDDNDLYSRGRNFLGMEPSKRSKSKLRNKVGRKKVTSDSRTKDIISVISRKY